MRRHLFLVGVVLLFAFGSGAGLAQSGYTLSVDGSHDVPDRTVLLEDEEYTIGSIAQVTPGEEIRIHVDAPAEDSTYDVELRDQARNLVMSRNGRTGDQIVSFPSDCQDCDHGSYVVALYENGELRTVQPVIIAGYDVSLSIPASVAQDETVTAEIEVAPTAAPEQPAGVEVALGNSGEEERVTATHEGGTSYTATIDLADLEPGTYTVYAGAVGNDQVANSDEREVLAISSSHTLDISAGGESGSGNSNGGNDGGGSGSGAESPSETATPTATEVSNEATETTTTTDAPSTETPQPTTSSERTATATTTPTEDVITPYPDTESPTETESDGPGPSIPLVLATLSGAGLWLRRRGR